MERQPIADPVRKPEEKPAAPAATDNVTFMVSAIRFSPASEVFSAEELKALASGFEGRQSTFADLRQLVGKINEAYKARGIVTAQAIIPPQDVSAGTITVQLVEGKLGAVHISGNASTRESYIADRLDAQPGQLVDLPTLEQSMKRFNGTNDVQLRAELKPGQSFGTTDLMIEAVEPPRHSIRLGVDNYGSEITGKTRTGLSYANQSLFGWRDALNLGFMSAGGLKSYSIDYGVPVTRSGGRVNLAYNKDDTSLKYGPFAPLNITGKSTGTSLSLRQPIHFGERSRTDFIAGLRKREVENRISGIFLSSTKTDDVQLGLEHQAGDDSGFWLVNYSLYNGRAKTADVSTRYTVGRASLRRTQFVAQGWTLRGAMAFQHTGKDELPSSEQFFLGGEGSVRGYPVGVYSGDQGVTLSLELHHPIKAPAAQPDATTLAATGFFFLDAGHVKIAVPPDSELSSSETLSSLGWGLEAAVGQHVSARVTLAYALRKLPDEKNRYSVNFQLNSQF